jgi:hypothetical protein
MIKAQSLEAMEASLAIEINALRALLGDGVNEAALGAMACLYRQGWQDCLDRHIKAIEAVPELSELLSRLAGFASHYGDETALKAGGNELIAKAQSLLLFIGAMEREAAQ